MRTLLLLFFATAASPLLYSQRKIEIGDLNGAKYRIDMPDKWNGGLIMYCHGYAQKPVSFDEKPNPLAEGFASLGYAVAQSGYVTGGWAVKEAIENTEELRRFFLRKYGTVKETYLMGHSMGGFMTMLMMERLAGDYKAGLALCGPLSSSTEFMNRGAFDGHVVFDFYFPGVLPDPNHVLEFQGWNGLKEKVLEAMKSKPEAAETVRRFGGQKSVEDLAGIVVFDAALIREMTVRAGGMPFDNRNVVYTLDGDYNALNDGVKRYSADPKAAAYLSAWYTPTGHLTAPMLAVHTTYDPLVPTWIPDRYLALTRTAGSSNLFVQQYVKHDGHCQISGPETVAAFEELKRWADGGPAPLGGTVPSGASVHPASSK